MIKIKNVEDVPVKLYHEDQVVGTIKTVLQFLDVRLQIRDEDSTKYYVKFKGKKVSFDNHGKLMTYPKGLFDKADTLFDKLIGYDSFNVIGKMKFIKDA